MASRRFAMKAAGLRSPRKWAERVGSPQRAAQGFVVLVCLSMMALTGWRVHLARDVALRDGRTDATNLARSIAEHAHATLQSADIVVTGMVERLRTGGTSAPALARLHDVLAARVAAFPSIWTLLVFDADGRCIVSSHAASMPGDFSDRAYFIHHRDNANTAAYVGPPIQSRADGRWNVTVSRRIDAPGGGFGGVAVATIDLETFAAFYNSFDFGPNGTIALLREDGTLVMRAPLPPDVIGRSFADSPFFRAYRDKGRSGIDIARSQLDGINRIRAFRQVDAYGLVVFAALAESDVLAPWRRDAAIAAAVSSVLSLTLGGFGWRLARQIRLRDRAEMAVRSRERQYRLLADNSTDLVVQLDPDFRRVYVSPSSMALLGYAPQELLGRSPAEIVNPLDHPALLGAFDALKAEGEAPPVTYRIRRKDGSEFWVEMIGRRLAGAEGFVMAVRDVADRKQAEEALHAANNQLQRMVMQDGLTGISNRRCFDMVLTKEVRRAARAETPLALLMIDVDHFKAFNDAYGHPAGDACLRAVAAAIATAIRRPGDLASRYGGEEFAVLLADTDATGARALAETIRLAVRALAIGHRGGVRGLVSVSLGVAVTWPHGETDAAADLVRLADAALYRAKGEGRDRACTADDGAMQPVQTVAA